jgi:phospholipase DDHD1
MKPSFLNPAKEPTSVSENEGIAAIPSPVTSPVLSRRHYGESITNIGKASILGNSSCTFLTYEHKYLCIDAKLREGG